MRTLRPPLLALAFFACSEPEQPAPPPPRVPVAGVIGQDVPVYIEAIGETAGSLDISIRARVDGVIEEVHFEEGHEVAKGDLLYTIDPTPFEAKVREAEGKLAEANARFVRAQSQLKRVRPLVAIDALSKSTLDDATAEFEASKGLVQAAEASVENAKIQRGYAEIRSPIDGLIGISDAYSGDYVGQYPNPVVLTTVSQLNPIKVRFSISERDYIKFARQHAGEDPSDIEKRDANLELFLVDGSLHRHLGKPSFAGREIDAQTGTLMIEAIFPNPEKILRPGQFARVRGTAKLLKGASVIPQRAVIEIQGTYQVAVIGDDDVVEMRRIVPGVRVEDNWQIDEGLSVGERVAVAGLHRIRSGMPVMPVTEEEEKSRKQGGK